MRPAACVLLCSLALRSRDHWQHLTDSLVPKLVIQGTRDKFCPLTTIRDYAQQYHDHRPEPGPMDLEIVDGADHFFDGIWDVSAALCWLKCRRAHRHTPVLGFAWKPLAYARGSPC